MSSDSAILLGLMLAVVLAAAALILFLRSGAASEGNDSLWLIQQQIDQLRSDLLAQQQEQTSQLTDTHRLVGNRLDNTSQQVAAVHKQLGTLEQATARVLEVGQSVVGIENLLRAPKLRGIMGELLLEELLRQGLPQALFSLQQTLRNGEVVDAVIRVGDKAIAVDAKFPLENYRRSLDATEPEQRLKFEKAFARDFRKHIDDVATKYLVPELGNLPLAFIYVPAESVYQQAVLGDWELTVYAMRRRVIPAGPLSFFAFLQSVLVGARALSASASASQLADQMSQLGFDLESLDSELAKLRRHLDNARSSLDGVGRLQARLTQTLTRSQAAADETLSDSAPVGSDQLS